MSCRHAFHQTCVDEWLQTGRNNCPACRTTVRSKASVLPRDSLPPHLGCDNWCRQFHPPHLVYKKVCVFSFYDSKKKNTFPPSRGPSYVLKVYFISLVIPDPCSGSLFLLVICNRFLVVSQSPVILSFNKYLPTMQHSISKSFYQVLSTSFLFSSVNIFFCFCLRELVA